jgi:putative membrane protein
MYGLAAMFVLIGIAAVLAVIYYHSSIQVTSPPSFDVNMIWDVIGLLFGIFFLVAIFGGMLSWWGWGWRRHRYRGYRGDAYEILRERYARGEITRDQFEQMMADLQRHES